MKTIWILNSIQTFLCFIFCYIIIGTISWKFIILVFILILILCLTEIIIGERNNGFKK